MFDDLFVTTFKAISPIVVKTFYSKPPGVIRGKVITVQAKFHGSPEVR